MFKINDFIFYSTTGVCQIIDIRIIQMPGVDSQECYIIRPLSRSTSTIYVPTKQNEVTANMRPIISKEDVLNLIKNMPNEVAFGIGNERDRSKEYSEKLRSCDSQELSRLIKTLSEERIHKQAIGKALSSTDSKIMSNAERLLHEEFAFVLGIGIKDVASFILERLPQSALQAP